MNFNRIAVRAASIVALSSLCIVGSPSLSSAREWTDNTGKYHLEAEFVKVVGETVHLRKPDGRVIAVVIARLNVAGRQAVTSAVQTQAKLAAGKVAQQPTVPASAAPVAVTANTISVSPKVALPQSQPSRVKQIVVKPSPVKRYPRSFAKILQAQKSAWQDTLNARLTLANALWSAASKYFDQQSASLANSENSRQPQPLAIGPAHAIEKVAKGLQAHRPRVVWDALPPSYQHDLNEVLHAYGAQLDPELWAASRLALQKAILVLHTKQEFVLKYPLVQEVLAESPASVNSAIAISTTGLPADSTRASWEATVRVLELLAESDLTDLKKLRMLDIGRFLDQGGVEIMQQLASASRSTADDSFNQGLSLLSSMQVSQVSMVGSDAVVLLTSGNQSEQNSMVLVEGKWIPTELAQAWPSLISSARAGLAMLADKSFVQQKPEWIAQLHAMEKAFDSLLAAKTQAEFDTLLDRLLAVPGEQ